MELNDYQEKALSFRLGSANEEYALLNLAGEVGELHSLIAKSIRDGALPNHRELVMKELGDILWCLAAVSEDYDFNLEDIALANIEKLNRRKQNNTLTGSGDNR